MAGSHGSSCARASGDAAAAVAWIMAARSRYDEYTLQTIAAYGEASILDGYRDSGITGMAAANGCAFTRMAITTSPHANATHMLDSSTCTCIVILT